MAGAWVLGKRYTGVLYGLSLEQIDREHGGLAMLSPTNMIGLNEFDTYIGELDERVKDAADV